MSEKKEKQAPAKPKKGKVIERKHNRTVPQGFATRDGKWKDLGGGFFQLKGPGNKTAFTTHRGGKVVSATRKLVTLHLQEQERIARGVQEAVESPIA